MYSYEKGLLVLIAEFQFDIDVNGLFPSVVSYLLVCRVLTQWAKFCKTCSSNGQKLYCTQLATIHPRFWIHLRSSFQHGAGKFMTVSHMLACLFYKPWKRHAATLRWGPYRVGYGMQGDISPVSWQGKTLLVMWMRWCDQMPTGDRLHSLNVFQSFP